MKTCSLIKHADFVRADDVISINKTFIDCFVSGREIAIPDYETIQKDQKLTRGWCCSIHTIVC